MREAIGDLWDLARDNGGVILITTNGTIKKNGLGVMGRGVAWQAKTRYPNSDLERRLGDLLRSVGNVPGILTYQIPPLISFPVKHNWWERADLELIARSARLVAEIAEYIDEPFWLPRPGCGNGGLRWEQVKPVIEPILDDRFIVVTDDR